MSLYKRGNVWYVKITGPDGSLIRQSTGTEDRRAAEEFHDTFKAKLWGQSRLGVKPERTWDEAALKWLQEKSNKRSIRGDKQQIAWFTQYLRGKTLNTISRQTVQELVEKKLGDVSDATRNRYVALIRAIFRRAQRKWEWIDHIPAFETYSESKRRVRWLTTAQADKLLSALPHHMRHVVLFSLVTGLRHANAVGVRWEWIIPEHNLLVIPGEHFKNGEDHPVPLNETALAVLSACEGKHKEVVFTYRGKPVKRLNSKRWRKALAEAGITDFRWHDLRHTWASWQIQNGTPTWILQELGGWKSAEMVRRYAHLNPAHLAPHARALDTVLGTLGHKSVHTQEKAPAEAEAKCLI